MAYMVARHSPLVGLIEPLPPPFSCHIIPAAIKLGIKQRYATREEADADAERLTKAVNDPTCLYLGTLADDRV